MPNVPRNTAVDVLNLGRFNSTVLAVMISIIDKIGGNICKLWRLR